MKPTFLQVDKEEMFPKLVPDPAYGLNVGLSGVFGINQDIIQVYNDKNVQLFSQYLVNVSLKGGWSIG